MLQTLLTRDPTADELHLLLSVRAAGSAGRATQVGLGQRVDQGRGPRGARAGSGAGSGPGVLRADLSRAHSDLGHLGEEGRGLAGGHWMPHQRGGRWGGNGLWPGPALSPTAQLPRSNVPDCGARGSHEPATPTLSPALQGSCLDMRDTCRQGAAASRGRARAQTGGGAGSAGRVGRRSGPVGVCPNED